MAVGEDVAEISDGLGALSVGLLPEGASSVRSCSPSRSSFAHPFLVSFSFSLPSGVFTRDSLKAAPKLPSESFLRPLRDTEGTVSSGSGSRAGLKFGASLDGATEGAVVSTVFLSVHDIFFRLSRVISLGVLAVPHGVTVGQRLVVYATRKFIQLLLMKLLMCLFL